jgi:hypothetical protein
MLSLPSQNKMYSSQADVAITFFLSALVLLNAQILLRSDMNERLPASLRVRVLSSNM